MENKWREMWDDRYSQTEYAYGTAPNQFVEEVLPSIEPKGRILFPAEGEGRNAVFAAELGWDVYAFDISEEGRKKALQLAEERGVEIHYELGDFFGTEMATMDFEAVAMIYNHFNPKYAEKYHPAFVERLVSEGTFLLEGFAESNLPLREKNPAIGGPMDRDMLYTVDKIKDYFPTLDPLVLEESEVILSEGLYHNGRSRIVRFVGKKN